MRHRRNLPLLLLVAGAACSGGPSIRVGSADPSHTSDPSGSVAAPATDPDDSTASDESEFSIDPAFRIDTLDNGLTVYLRENDIPGAQVELRLAVDAGSAAEQGPTGTAHFLEHMLFNGTERFPGNELTDVLADFGSTLGPDVNAATGYDDTVFTLTVPNRTEAIDTGLEVMAQWLSAATIDPEEVERERGVITDEWRQSEQSLDGRIFDAIDGLLTVGSSYEGRDPIGTAEDIAAITSEDLRAFYDRWYRPEHAALVVVGDVDADELAEAVAEQFGALSGRGDGGPAFAARWSPPAATKAAVVDDPDVESPFVEITFPHAAVPAQDTAELRRSVAAAVALDIVATRLSDDIARGELVAERASVDDNSLARAIDAPTLLVNAGEEDLPAAADALVAEVERARRFGVTAAELERSVGRFVTLVEEEYAGRGTIADAEWADDALEHFLVGEPLVDPVTRYEIQIGVLEGLDPDTVGSALAELLDRGAPQFLAGTAEGSVDTESLLARWRGAGSLELEPRPDATGPDLTVEGLMQAPEAVEEDDRRELDGDSGSYLSPVELRFANGATVILNAEAISDGSVSVAAVSHGGSSLLPDTDVAAAAVAVDTVLSSGVGDLDAVALDQELGSSSVELFGSIDDVSEYLYADIAADDLELTFQYLHQLMTAPRVDQGALERAVAYLEPVADGGGADQDSAGYVALLSAMYGPDPRVTGVPSADALAAVTADDVERVWADRFGDVGGFVFVVVGDFDLDDGLELARRYVGSLPGGRRETFTDVRVRPSGVERVTVEAGTGDKAQLQLGWWTPVDDRAHDELAALLAVEVLDQRLMASLREDLGATYSPSSYVEVVSEPTLMVETTLIVTGAPAGMAGLSEAIQVEIESLRSGGVTDEEWDDALSAVTEELGYVYQGQQLDVLARFGLGDTAAIERYLDMALALDDIERSDLDAFVRRILPADRWVEVTVLPS